MKFITSRTNGREFCVLAASESPVEGIPCFTEDEVFELRLRAYSPQELDEIFDKRVLRDARRMGKEAFKHERSLAEVRAREVREMLLRKRVGYEPVVLPDREVVLEKKHR